MPGNDSYTKLLLHMNGADASTIFTDSSLSTKTVTAVADAQIDAGITDAFGGTAGCGLFGGDGDYLSVPDSADWSLGNTFTIDFWVRFNTISNQSFLYQRKNTVSVVGIDYDATGKVLQIDSYIWSGSVTPFFITAPFDPAEDTWYHIAVVRIDDGNTAASWRIFVDGEGQTLTLAGGAWNGAYPDVANYIAIGRTGDHASGYVNGWLDEFRISKGIARWTSNFTPPTAPYSLDSSGTVTWQPSVADNYLRKYVPNTNMGTDAALEIQAPEVGYVNVERILLNMDFSALPAGATISSAVLSLFYFARTYDPVGHEYWVYRLTQTGWTETGSTWNKYDGSTAWTQVGGDFTTTDGASAEIPADVDEWVDWDVTEQVKYAQANTSNIAYFLIKDGDESATVNIVAGQFHSKEYTTDTSLCPKLVITYTVTPTLVVQDGSQGQAVGNVVVTQVHNVSVAGGVQSQAVDNVVLIQVHVLTPANGVQGQAVGNVVLAQTHALSVAGGVQSQAVDNVVLIQVHVLTPANGVQGQAVGNVVLAQTHALSVAGGVQAQAVNNAVLTQTHILTVASGLQSQEVDNVDLDLATFLIVADGTQGQSVNAVVLSQVHKLTVASGAQAQTAEDVILTQNHNLAIAGGSQAQAVGNVVLTTSAPPTSPIKVLLVSGNMIIQVG